MTDADREMIFPTQALPQTPARLLWLFARSLAVSALIAAAAYAALYVAHDMRTRAAPAAGQPQGNAVVAPGLELLTPYADAEALAAAVGFTPVLPEQLPDGVVAPKFDATQPDASGVRRAEIRYAARRDGGGPALLLVESLAAAGSPASFASDGAIGRYAAAVRCGDVSVAALLFFPASAPPADAATSAAGFFDALRAQCGS